MLGLLLLIALGVWVVFYQQSISTEVKSTKLSNQLDKLWHITQGALREKKYLKAEKALLTILRFDEKNATAYNRLGILYAKQHAYNDAIECFEIAQSLEPSASSLHNVGLIYFETEQYEKAALAFEQALSMEDALAARHIAYAKVQEKLGNNKRMIESLEHAVSIEPNRQSFKILADAYARNGQEERADRIYKKLERLISTSNQARRIKQPRKVVI
jgi:tetratricopeptide (TPR) repeat protein